MTSPAADGRPPAAPNFEIRRGVCCPMFAFDIAFAIDLDEAERRLRAASERPTLRHARKSPPYFQYRPAPLSVPVPIEPIEIARGGIEAAGKGFRTTAVAEVLVFDFGAASVSYRIPIEGDLAHLADLSAALSESAALADDARRRVGSVAAAIAGAATGATGSAAGEGEPAEVGAGAGGPMEDYIVWQIEELSASAPPSSVLDDAPDLVARILRAETGPMSPGEVADALSSRLSYRPDDAVIVDWNSAVLLDRDAAELRPILEFANVELLEIRHLDDRLDVILEQAYRASQRRRQGLRAILPGGSAPMRRIAQLQVDSALLFENINNALKLIGDQYVARIYRLAAERFHLPERDATIARKLETIQSIYSKMTDAQASRRAELLEWIIILLIAFEVVYGLAREFGGGGGK